LIAALDKRRAIAWSPYVAYFAVIIVLLAWWAATDSNLALVLVRFAAPAGILLTFYYLPRLKRMRDRSPAEEVSRAASTNPGDEPRTSISGALFLLVAAAAGTIWLVLSAVGLVSR
jgi:hypothetical protein